MNNYYVMSGMYYFSVGSEEQQWRTIEKATRVGSPWLQEVITLLGSLSASMQY